jgi:hypothetical protein
MSPDRKLFGPVAPVARNKRRGQSIVPVAHPDTATCLMVYILASLPKDFK